MAILHVTSKKTAFNDVTGSCEMWHSHAKCEILRIAEINIKRRSRSPNFPTLDKNKVAKSIRYKKTATQQKVLWDRHKFVDSLTLVKRETMSRGGVDDRDVIFSDLFWCNSAQFLGLAVCQSHRRRRRMFASAHQPNQPSAKRLCHATRRCKLAMARTVKHKWGLAAAPSTGL